jgi:hypothetical protein
VKRLIFAACVAFAAFSATPTAVPCKATATCALPVASGDLVAVFTRGAGTGAPTDSQGNVYVLVRQSNTYRSQRRVYSTAATATGTLTVTFPSVQDEIVVLDAAGYLPTPDVSASFPPSGQGGSYAICPPTAPLSITTTKDGLLISDWALDGTVAIKCSALSGAAACQARAAARRARSTTKWQPPAFTPSSSRSRLSGTPAMRTAACIRSRRFRYSLPRWSRLAAGSSLATALRPTSSASQPSGIRGRNQRWRSGKHDATDARPVPHGPGLQTGRHRTARRRERHQRPGRRNHGRGDRGQTHVDGRCGNRGRCPGGHVLDTPAGRRASADRGPTADDLGHERAH